MPANEISRIHGLSAARPVSRETQGANVAPKRAAHAASDSSAVKVETAGDVDIRQIPVDAERVALIRGALQDGTYPLLPAKTADAMIAARMLLAIES